MIGDPRWALSPASVLCQLSGMIAGTHTGQRQPEEQPPPTVWATLSTPPGGPDLLGEALFAYGDHPAERCRVEARLLSQFDLSLAWLLSRVDASLMQASVEGRVPFLEPEVVRLVLNLPLEARIGPWSKGILRDIARSLLPLSVAHRPKIAGMDFDAGAWIEEASDATFLTQGLLRETLAVPEAEFTAAMASANGRMRMRIWSAEVWCRSLLARHTNEQIEQALWR
jgi:asparagine synthase (glutamine-hydrolysing)